MSAYLSISIGETPATARPLLASTDPDIVRGAVQAILGKVDASGGGDARNASPSLASALLTAATATRGG